MTVEYIIAGLALYIAFQQYQNERYKVRVDLFDRRYKVYDSVGEIIARCIMGPLTHDDPKGFAFAHEIAKTERVSRLLFNKEINQEIKMVCDNAMRLMEIVRRINPLDGEGLPSGPERNSLIEERSKLFKYFTTGLSSLELLFATQLRLNK